MVWIVLDFVAQTPDVPLDVGEHRVSFHVPHSIVNLLGCQHSSWSLGQVKQQAILCGRQLNFLTTYDDCARGCIDDKIAIAVAQNRLFCRACASAAAPH